MQCLVRSDLIVMSHEFLLPSAAAKLDGLWLRRSWHVASAYMVGFFVVLAVIGWHPDRQDIVGRGRTMKLGTAGWVIVGAVITCAIYTFMVVILKYS